MMGIYGHAEACIEKGAQLSCSLWANASKCPGTGALREDIKSQGDLPLPDDFQRLPHKAQGAKKRRLVLQTDSTFIQQRLSKLS